MKKHMKKLALSAMILTMAGTNVFASSITTLPNGIVQFQENENWQVSTDNLDKVPTIKLKIEDAYKLAGKKESFDLILENAEWVNGDSTSLAPYDLEGLKITNMTLTPKDKKKIKVELSIPEDIQEDEVLSLTIPLCIQTINEDIVYINVAKNSNTNLVEEGRYLIAVSATKSILWEVQDIPNVNEVGEMAPILFSETTTGAIGSRDFSVIIELQGDHFVFGEPEYLNKKVFDDTTQYDLDIDDYITYGGGFKAEGQKLKLVQYNSHPEKIRITMTGSVPSQPGTILLSHLPIKNVGATLNGVKVNAVVSGDNLLSSEEEAQVAWSVTTTKEETTTEEEVKEEVKEEVATEESKEEAKEDSKEAKVICFKVGESSYTVDDQTYEMDGATFMQAPGYTMVPIRYVAKALGIEEDQISFGNGQVFLNYGKRSIILTVGSKEAYLNGATISMQTALVNKDGRVYAPIGEVANLLGVKKQWEAASKTAIFEK